MAKPWSEVSNDFDRSLHTFTFESLFYEAKEHLTTKVTKCRRSVGVDRQKVWSNDCLILGNFCYKTSGIEKLSTENNNKLNCALLKLSTRDKQGVADWKGTVRAQRVTIRVIFVWPWKMVSVRVCYLFYQAMDEKNKHGFFVFLPKKTLIWRRHCSIGHSCCSMTSKRSIGWFLESSSGIKFFQPSVRLTNQKPGRFVSVR